MNRANSPAAPAATARGSRWTTATPCSTAADARSLTRPATSSATVPGFSRAFSYSPTASQLCSVDIITVVNQGAGPTRGASCGLGPFVPVKPAEGG